MKKMQLSMTASKPSFGMPAFGAASTISAACASRVVVRDRHLGGIAVVTAGEAVAAAKATYPGTAAWRPPTC